MSHQLFSQITGETHLADARWAAFQKIVEPHREYLTQSLIPWTPRGPFVGPVSPVQDWLYELYCDAQNAFAVLHRLYSDLLQQDFSARVAGDVDCDIYFDDFVALVAAALFCADGASDKLRGLTFRDCLAQQQ